MTEDIALATPTRFLIENGEWNLTPSLTGSIHNEINPFDCNFPSKTNDTANWIVASPTMYTKSAFYASPEPEPSLSLTQSPASSRSSFSLSSESSIDIPPQPQVIAPTTIHSPTPPQEEATRRSSRIQTKSQPSFAEYLAEEDPKPQQKSASVHGGRKRRIVFEGDDAEDRRKKFLERNRIAAYKCRQKKKNWMQELEQKAEIQSNHNDKLHALVAQLKEESIYLRNLLLTHGNCNCDSVQTYLRKTSAEITNGTSPTMSRRGSATTTTTFPYNSMLSFAGTSTGLTPFLNTVINKAPSEPNDYFSQSHTES